MDKNIGTGLAACCLVIACLHLLLAVVDYLRKIFKHALCYTSFNPRLLAKLITAKKQIKMGIGELYTLVIGIFNGFLQCEVPLKHEGFIIW